jgi:mono/diheme cytochrome c family protein
MRSRIVPLAVAALAVVPLLAAQKPKSAGKNASAATLAHGKYLVEEVGKCGDCHTPDNDKGEPIKEKLLQGAPLGFKPLVPFPGWADTAPAIAGLPGWERDAAIKFLRTGIGPKGLPLRPPMPDYHLKQADAEAIVAYLKSLAPAK